MGSVPDPDGKRLAMKDICSVELCARLEFCRGWCQTHYNRWRLLGDVDASVPVRAYVQGGARCTSCEDVAEARGLCHKHYQRWKYRKNPAKFQEWEKQRRRMRPEHVRALDNAEYQRNKERHLHRIYRRRAVTRGASGAHTLAEWVDVLLRYGGRCAYCGASGDMTKDHIIPISRGGSDCIDNIVPACLSCNASKGPKTIGEWCSGAIVCARTGLGMTQLGEQR